jgi:hypothetical protein
MRPAERCVPERLRNYIGFLEQHLSATTVLHLIGHLHSVLAAFDPNGIGRHLRDATRHLRRRVRETPSIEVLALEDFVCIGRSLMEAARNDADPREAVNWVMFRDGLLCALPPYRSLRRANLAGMRIGHELKEINGRYWIAVSPLDTKIKGKGQYKPWPEALDEDLRQYLHYRELMLKGEPPTDRLCITYRRIPQNPRSLREAFARRTGHGVHDVRHATASKARDETTGAVMLGNTRRVARGVYRHRNKASTLRVFHEQFDAPQYSGAVINPDDVT